MKTFHTWRAALLLSVLALGLIGMSGRVAYLQTIGRDNYLRSAERQQFETVPLYARRGTIFDSNLIVMAATIQRQRLYVDPKFLESAYNTPPRSYLEKKRVLEKLATLIDCNPQNLIGQIEDRAAGRESTWQTLLSDKATTQPFKKDRYMILAEELDDRAVEEIHKLNIPGLGFEAISKRIYPMGSPGAHAIGAVGKDDSGRGQRGLEGVELKFNDLLAGIDGHERAEKNARRQKISVTEEDYVPPRHGQHLVLTIDANIQMIAEQELAAGCEQFGAKRGEVVVMDPHTGEILAMANWPTFNPQNIEDSRDEDRRNRCITDPFEAGSVIKPFVAGPAMAANITKPDEIWNIPGITYVTPYGRHITDVHGYGKLATWDVLVKSSNIGMSMLGERMGNPQLYKALTSFGFGQSTGIELPGENHGRINPLKEWNHFSTESVAQGYEMMVTPLQLARAFCAYANGGHLPPAHIIKGTLSEDGAITPFTSDVQLSQQVIDSGTAAEMRRILCDVVIRGTATKARSQYWNIFGKTGTAHISEGKAGYSATRFNSSFICGAPFESPRLVVALLIHEPAIGQHYGGAVAAPCAQRVVDRTLSYLQVPSSPELAPPPLNVASVLYSYDASAYKRLTPEAAKRAHASIKD